MIKAETRKQVALALEAAKDKKAEDISLLELPRESSAFTDYFLICSGSNPRQVQAIADAIDEALSKQMGLEPNNREGYDNAEWVLLDYVDFVCHIFNAESRRFYDLERLWKSATKVTEEDLAKVEKKPVKKAAAAAEERVVRQKPGKKQLVGKARPGAKKSAAKKTSARPAAKKSSAKKSAKKSGRR